MSGSKRGETSLNNVHDGILLEMTPSSSPLLPSVTSIFGCIDAHKDSLLGALICTRTVVSVDVFPLMVIRCRFIRLFSNGVNFEFYGGCSSVYDINYGSEDGEEGGMFGLVILQILGACCIYRA